MEIYRGFGVSASIENGVVDISSDKGEVVDRPRRFKITMESHVAMNILMNLEKSFMSDTAEDVLKTVLGYLKSVGNNRNVSLPQAESRMYRPTTNTEATKKVKVTKEALAAADSIRKLWRSVSTSNPWENFGARQAYMASLEAMKQSGLINDYDLHSIS